MIETALDNLLEATLTPERYKLFVEAIAYLEGIEYETIQDELLNFAFESMADDERIDKPESLIIDDMHEHLVQCLTSQLRLTGIEVTDEATLKQRLDLAVAVGNIPAYEDLGSVISATYLDETNSEKLAEVLHMTTSIPAVLWSEILEDVSLDLIKTIQRFSVSTVNSEYDEVERLSEYLQKLRIYKEFTDQSERTLLFYRLVETNKIGRNFEDYIDTGILTDYFEGNEMEKLAFEIYGMALMSNDGRQDPPTAVRECIEKYLSDTVRIVKLNNEVSNVNSNFVKFFQTVSKGLTT